MSFDPGQQPHRRHNPLTDEYVLVSPHRAARPWSGQIEKHEDEPRPSYEPTCPLCAGNTRAGGEVNPDYHGPFVFDNDFAALLPGESADPVKAGLFSSAPVSGRTRVICYSEDHSKSLGELPQATIHALIQCWMTQVIELSRRYPWVQVFENRGAMMGSSQPHPHGQVWASSFIPNEVAVRQKHLGEWHQRKQSNLLLVYLEEELVKRVRIVFESEHWVVLVPYWAAWPFETMVLPKAHRAKFEDLSPAEAADLASVLKRLATRYDNLFKAEFPWSMGWYFAPPGESKDPWQLHAVFYPPLLRSATIRKFMVGYEMLAEVQRDITPEAAAEQLRSSSEFHYRDAG